MVVVSKHNANVRQNSLLNNFRGHDSFLWGHWHPYFRLLVPSVLVFKAMVEPLTCRLHAFLRWTSAKTPAILLVASMVAEPLSRTYFFKHWGESEL